MRCHIYDANIDIMMTFGTTAKKRMKITANYTTITNYHHNLTPNISMEVEYVASTKEDKDMIWLQFFMEELGGPSMDNYLFKNEKNTIYLVKKSSLHSKTKHI